MKINSKDLFKYINYLKPNEIIKFKVYYDDCYLTEIFWDGKDFNWESGMFSSGAFFDELYDFEIMEDKSRKIEKIEMCTSGIMGYDGVENITTELKNKINELIEAVNYLLEKSDE